MTDAGPGRVTAVVVAFGETPLLEDCVARLLASLEVDVDLLVVDNGSRDGSVERVASRDRVKAIRPGANLGYGGAGNLAVAAIEAGHDHIVAFINPDVLVEPDALFELSEVASDPHVGIASASVRLLADPDLVNSAGGAIHFLGLGWSEGFGHRASEFSAPRCVTAASGAAMALRVDVFRTLGGFTDELFLYHEDAELSWRSWMSGLEVRYVPSAVVLHDYDFGRNTEKLYLLERNRILLVVTCYSRRTLALLFPALVVFEFGMFALAASQGWWRDKVGGWIWIVRHLPWVRAQRARVQAARRRSDRQLAPLLCSRFTGEQIPFPRLLHLPDLGLDRYWRRVRRFV